MQEIRSMNVGTFSPYCFVERITVGQPLGILQDNLFGGPGDGHIYFTHIDVWSVCNLKGESVTIQLQGAESGPWWIFHDSEATDNGIITSHVRLSGMNLKAPGSERWQLALTENNLKANGNFTQFCFTFIWNRTPE